MAYGESIKREAKRLYCSGWSCNEVAEKLNLNPDTVFRWRARYQWDEETADDSIEGVKRQIAAIGASDEPLSEAQARKLDKLTRAVERMERSAAREEEGGPAIRAGRPSHRRHQGESAGQALRLSALVPSGRLALPRLPEEPPDRILLPAGARSSAGGDGTK